MADDDTLGSDSPVLEGRRPLPGVHTMGFLTDPAADAGGNRDVSIPSGLAGIDDALADLRLWRFLLRIGFAFTVPVSMLFLGALLWSTAGTGAVEGLLGNAGAMGLLLIVLRRLGRQISDLESDRAFRVAFPELVEGSDGHGEERPKAAPGSGTIRGDVGLHRDVLRTSSEAGLRPLGARGQAEPTHQCQGRSMQAKCFACEAVIEGEDLDALADAFVSHGRDRHAWTYPEEAIRNYARNYAEATERLTGSTERLPRLGELTIRRVNEAQVEDWLDFFDHDAFAGNPDWASCYCLEPHVPGSPEEPEGGWRERRAAMAERLRNEGTYGYLAYVDGRAAGWVNASFRSDYGLYRSVDPDGPSPRGVIGVSCFVVAPPFRRHGVASALLDRVIEDAAARGAAWIEGYPRNEPEAGDAGHFRGPRSMYEARGFVPVEVRQRDTVVRRPVP